MKIGALELLVVFIVALLVIGPDKLPLYAKKLGAALRDFRKASQEVTQEFRESVIDPLEEAQKPLREAMEPLEEMDRGIKSDLKGVEDGLNSIGKGKGPKPKEAAQTASGGDAEKSAAADAASEAAASGEQNGGDAS